MVSDMDARQTRGLFARKNRGRFARRAQVLREAKSASLRMTKQTGRYFNDESE
jgi:hypothetical protein